MRYLLPLLFLLCSCVSQKLADANLASVEALGAVAVQVDKANMPEAQDAVDNAQALAEAAAPIPQVLHFGVPSELVAANTEHVDALAAKVDVTKPEVKTIVKKAKDNAAVIEGKAKTQGSLLNASKSTGLPWLDGAITALTLFGSAVGSIYGATRGRKRLTAWWNNAPTDPVTAPAATVQDPPKVA